MPERTKNYKFLWIAGGFFFLLFYFIFDPLKYGWMPQCVFHKLTGLQCMGCGSQRVVHSLLHGDFSGAWHANAFLVMACPFLIFLLWLEFSRNRFPVLYAKIHSQFFIITVASLLFLWLIIRNLLSI